MSQDRQTQVSFPLFLTEGLTFFWTTSCQLMLIKNRWFITSLASLGPPPNLSVQIRCHKNQTTYCPKRLIIERQQFSTSVWGLSWADQLTGIWLREKDFWGSGSPPWEWAQTDAHGPGCKTAGGHTSFHTWQHQDPTSPQRGRSHYLPGPVKHRRFRLSYLGVHFTLVTVQNFFPSFLLHRCTILSFFTSTIQTSSARLFRFPGALQIL